MTDVIRTSKEIDVIRAWMQTQWERIPAVPHSQPGSYARGYDGGLVDILRGLQATLDKLPPAHETSDELTRENKAASDFIRGCIEALGVEQPPEGFMIDLDALLLQVIGEIESLKGEVLEHAQKADEGRG